MRQRTGRWAAGIFLAGWMLLIFCFSAQPAAESTQISMTVSYRLVSACDRFLGLELPKERMERWAQRMDYPVRKAAHMAEYAVLGMLAYAWTAGRGGGAYVRAFLIAACYAATDELHQRFVPGRAGRISDVCVDMAGAALGLLGLCIILKIAGKHCEKKKLPLQ